MGQMFLADAKECNTQPPICPPSLYIIFPWQNLQGNGAAVRKETGATRSLLCAPCFLFALPSSNTPATPCPCFLFALFSPPHTCHKCCHIHRLDTAGGSGRSAFRSHWRAATTCACRGEIYCKGLQIHVIAGPSGLSLHDIPLGKVWLAQLMSCGVSMIMLQLVYCTSTHFLQTACMQGGHSLFYCWSQDLDSSREAWP